MLSIPFSQPNSPILDTAAFSNYMKNHFFDIPKDVITADIHLFAQIRRDALSKDPKIVTEEEHMHIKVYISSCICMHLTRCPL
jgi:hypothetical protein